MHKKAKPILKSLVDKIELREEDLEIPPREDLGFKGYTLKDVLVPYVNDKRIGHFRTTYRNSKSPIFTIRYVIEELNEGIRSYYYFSRVVYIKLNKHDPRVVETENHYDIVNNLLVDHDEDILIKGEKHKCKKDNKQKQFKFVIKPDRQKNLQLLTNKQNIQKQNRRRDDRPKHIYWDRSNCNWGFWLDRPEIKLKHKKTFAILSHGWEGAYKKAVDYGNQYLGTNYICDLKHAVPEEFKGRSEESVFKECNRRSFWHKKQPKQLELDLDELAKEETEKSICWLGIIPECDKDKVRYPTDEEIEIALYEAENLTEEEYDSMSEKELEDFHEKAKKIIKEKMNEE